MKNLSANLKKLLLNSKLSENELARRTGISQQIINRILSGENKNPKIATLSPLANYFMVSISQLIGEELAATETRLNTNHLGWQEIPFIEWNDLEIHPMNQLLLLQNRTLLIDIEPSRYIFAVRIQDGSMEPKFSEGTLLIFDIEKKPTNGDFILLGLPNDEVVVRQFFTKNSMCYMKCLNPQYADYSLTIIEERSNYISTLIQSRTDYATR